MLLDIYAQIAPQCKGVERQVPRMRYVETNSSLRGECGFSLRTVYELDLLCPAAAIAAKKETQRPARQKERLSKTGKSKPVSPIQLIVREDCLELTSNGRGTPELQTPDVHAALDQAVNFCGDLP